MSGVVVHVLYWLEDSKPTMNMSWVSFWNEWIVFLSTKKGMFHKSWLRKPVLLKYDSLHPVKPANLHQGGSMFGSSSRIPVTTRMTWNIFRRPGIPILTFILTEPRKARRKGSKRFRFREANSVPIQNVQFNTNDPSLCNMIQDLDTTQIHPMILYILGTL